MFETVTRTTTARGETVVRRDEDGELELRVNGVFVMGTTDHVSEQRMATAALATADDPRRVLVGGLGLGYTVRALLADPRVRELVVAELEPAIVEWMREGLLPGAEALADPRVDLRIGDVRAVVEACRAERALDRFDSVLLDVDNGPGSLVHSSNAGVYEASFVRDCADLLGESGHLCVWSQADSPALRRVLGSAFEHVHVEAVPVRLGTRADAYWLLTGRTPRR